MNGPLRAALLFRYAQLLAFFGQQAPALKLLQTVVRENPRHQRAWTFIGFMRAQKKEPDAAIEAFDRAIALRPSDADTHFNAGFVLQQAGRHAEAMKYFEQAIAHNPYLDRAWYGLGLSLAHERRYGEAAVKFKEAGRLQPFNPYAGYQLAHAWFELGEHDKVRAEYERIKAFDPKVAERIRLDFGVLKS